MGCGTGGTLSGIVHYLKPKIPHLRVVLADPLGSGLYNKVKHKVMFSPFEADGKRKRHQVDTIVEGIGINRLTSNFKKLIIEKDDDEIILIDDAVKVTDQEAIYVVVGLI